MLFMYLMIAEKSLKFFLSACGRWCTSIFSVYSSD